MALNKMEEQPEIKPLDQKGGVAGVTPHLERGQSTLHP